MSYVRGFRVGDQVQRATFGWGPSGTIIGFERRDRGDCQVRWFSGRVTTEYLSFLVRR